MRFTAFAAVAIALAAAQPLFAPAAQAQSSAEQMSPQTFVEKAAISDLFEIRSSKLALEKSENEEIRSFAEMMVNDHTKASKELESAAKAADLEIPSALDSKHEEMLEKLGASSGREFEQMYSEMQVKGHQDALKLHRNYARNGENASLKAIAEKMAPIIEGHLDRAQRLP